MRFGLAPRTVGLSQERQAGKRICEDASDDTITRLNSLSKNISDTSLDLPCDASTFIRFKCSNNIHVGFRRLVND